MSGEGDSLFERLGDLERQNGELAERLTALEASIRPGGTPFELTDAQAEQLLKNSGFPTPLLCSYCLKENSLPGVDYCSSCGEIGWPR